ncbi:MAG: hypothetical protein AAFN74_03235 [Myxococcota bacterium]
MIAYLVLAGVATAPPLNANRNWDVLTATASTPAKLVQAGRKLGPGRFNLAGVWLNGDDLQKLGRPKAGEPLTRFVRESVGRPVDVEDFLYFADDLLHQADDPNTIEAYLPAGRARAVGILVHPRDIFRNEPRRYGEKFKEFSLELPKPQVGMRPPADGTAIGPDWAARYQQPSTQAGRMQDLMAANPSFARRVASLIEQLKAQGAFVYVEATVRAPERGLLLYGSFLLSRSKSKRALEANIEALCRYNAQWDLNVPITWHHPDGWEATVAAARALADTYGVVYATRRGAKASDHYGGSAIDLFVVNLPRYVRLSAPDGAHWTADLSAEDESRDLSLSPKLIEWIEEHFQFKKLRGDYPHWSDAIPPEERTSEKQAADRQAPKSTLTSTQTSTKS